MYCVQHRQQGQDQSLTQGYLGTHMTKHTGLFHRPTQKETLGDQQLSQPEAIPERIQGGKFYDKENHIASSSVHNHCNTTEQLAQQVQNLS
jgi:hypothetical protein